MKNTILFSDLCAAVLVTSGVDILTKSRNAAFYRKIVIYLASSRLVASSKTSLQKQQDIALLLGLNKSTVSIQLNELTSIANMKGSYGDRFRNTVEIIWNMALLISKEPGLKTNTFHIDHNFVKYDRTASSIAQISAMVREARLSLAKKNPNDMNEVVRLDNGDLWIPSMTRELLVRNSDYVIYDNGQIRVVDQRAFELTIFGR